MRVTVDMDAIPSCAPGRDGALASPIGPASSGVASFRIARVDSRTRGSRQLAGTVQWRSRATGCLAAPRSGANEHADASRRRGRATDDLHGASDRRRVAIGGYRLLRSAGDERPEATGSRDDRGPNGVTHWGALTEHDRRLETLAYALTSLSFPMRELLRCGRLRGDRQIDRAERRQPRPPRPGRIAWAATGPRRRNPWAPSRRSSRTAPPPRGRRPAPRPGRRSGTTHATSLSGSCSSPGPTGCSTCTSTR